MQTQQKTNDTQAVSAALRLSEINCSTSCLLALRRKFRVCRNGFKNNQELTCTYREDTGGLAGSLFVLMRSLQ